MKAVIFDLDGVIINSEPLHFLSDKTLLEKLEIEVPENYLEKFVGVTSLVMWKEIITEFDIQKDLQEILNLQLSLKLKLLKKSTLTAIEGIPQLLNELYIQDIPVAIASSSSSIFIKEVVNKLHLGKYISLWVSAENVEKSKPEGDVFIKAAELLDVNPEQCIVIEDSKNGIAAAKKAGMKCIGYKNPNSGNQDLSKADSIVASIHEITLTSMEKLIKS